MKKVVAALAVLVVVVLVGFGTWYFTSSQATYSGKPESITVGGPALEQSALIYIAQDQSFFAKNGLNVTIRDDYPTGVGPVRDMVSGKLDVSVSAEYPVIAPIFNGENISIIGAIDKYENEEIIGRKDRGILNISDLRGKKIGLPKGTILEFFLGRFLELHGISQQDVALVDVNASQSVESIAGGDVDAIMYFQPYVYRILERLGDNGISWPGQSNQQFYAVMASRNDWISSHPRQINRFLISLDQALEYSISHPAETEIIVQKRLNLRDAYLATVWPKHHFSLSLDQSLLIAMNDEGRWMIINNLTAEKTLPYFQDHVYTTALKAVKPESVNIL